MNTPTKPFQAFIAPYPPRADFQYFGRYYTNSGVATVVPETEVMRIPAGYHRRKFYHGCRIGDASFAFTTGVVNLVWRFKSVRNEPAFDVVFRVQMMSKTKYIKSYVGRYTDGLGRVLPYNANHIGGTSAFCAPVEAFHAASPVMPATSGKEVMIPNWFVGEFDRVTLEILDCPTDLTNFHVIGCVYSEQIVEAK